MQAEARVPVIGHLDGNCHVYVDRDADLSMAREVVLNAKLRRTGVCGAAETVLFDRSGNAAAPVLKALLDAGCEVRGDETLQRLDARIVPATEADWSTEYLEPIIAAKVVDGVDKSGFIKAAEPIQDQLAKELGPHAIKILDLVRKVKVSGS